jgi:hypothetical protein
MSHGQMPTSFNPDQPPGCLGLIIVFASALVGGSFGFAGRGDFRETLIGVGAGLIAGLLLMIFATTPRN